MPVVPATQETEAEVNLGGRGCSELRSCHCHCTPAWRQSETPSQKREEEDDEEVPLRPTINSTMI